MKTEPVGSNAKQRLTSVEFVCLIALLTSLTAASIDAVLPALRSIGESLQVVDSRDLPLVITIFVVGMIPGELVFGPLSDAKGRKLAIIAGLLVFIAGTILAMTAASLTQVLIGRAIQGFGVSGPKIATRALVRDLYTGNDMARIMSFVFSVMIFIPMIAPTVGQWLMYLSDWHAIFYFYLILAVVGALWLHLRQTETLTPEKRIPLKPGTLRRNIKTIISDRLVMTYTVAVGFIFGSFLIYLGNSQAIFFDIYRITTEFPMYFAILALGIGLSSFTNGRLVTRYGAIYLSMASLIAMIIISTIFMAISLKTNSRPPLLIFMVCCASIFACLGFLFSNLNALALQTLGDLAGIGAALVSSISGLIAALFAVGIGRFYDQTVLVLNLGFILGSVCALLLILVGIPKVNATAPAG